MRSRTFCRRPGELTSLALIRVFVAAHDRTSELSVQLKAARGHGCFEPAVPVKGKTWDILRKVDL